MGFYSAFMVADKVTVISKAYGSDEAWQWESSGVDGYTIDPAKDAVPAPRSSCTSSPTPTTENYDNFLDEYGIVAIVKKYSDYVRYPIQMEREKSRQKPKPEDAGPRTTSPSTGDLHRAGDPEQHDPHLEEAEERSDR